MNYFIRRLYCDASVVPITFCASPVTISRRKVPTKLYALFSLNRNLDAPVAYLNDGYATGVERSADCYLPIAADT